MDVKKRVFIAVEVTKGVKTQLIQQAKKEKRSLSSYLRVKLEKIAIGKDAEHVA